MKRSELVTGTVYAYAAGSRIPEPVRLLDLRLWKLSASKPKSSPEAWFDVTGVRGARPGRAAGYGPGSMTGYLVLRASRMLDVTPEQLSAVKVDVLPGNSRRAAKYLAELSLPKGFQVDLVLTSHLRCTWTEYARAKAVTDADEQERRNTRAEKIKENEAAWKVAFGRLEALGVQDRRLTTAADAADEPRIRLSLTELGKLLDLAEGKRR